MNLTYTYAKNLFSAEKIKELNKKLIKYYQEKEEPSQFGCMVQDLNEI